MSKNCIEADSVTFFTNGNIMVFDKGGKQMLECQGCILNVKTIKNLNEHCNKGTKFYFGTRDNPVRNVLNLEWWFNKKSNQKGGRKNV